MESYPYKNYKIVDADQLNADLTSVADAIRIKGKTTASLDFPDGFVGAIDNIKTGDDAQVAKKDVNFYDYDGTLLNSYTVAEAQALTELPELPEREGLICQGWNWTLEDIKAHNRAVDVGATYTTDDGTTRIYIHLEEGRTSPMLGVCPNGTVTVDWGDGTTPDTLTGTSTSTVKWTPSHEYAEPGDYVIRLTVDGTMGIDGNLTTNQYSYILRHSSGADTRNIAYQNSLKKIEIGNNVASFGAQAFGYCYSLESIVIPNSVKSFGKNAFNTCYSLKAVVIPNGVTSIIDDVFNGCLSLKAVVIPNSVKSFSYQAFNNIKTLASIVIPNSVTSFGNSSFANCTSLTSIVIPNSVKSFGSSVFNKCYGIAYFDFTNCTAVPTLSSSDSFSNIASDCKIYVPAALHDEWIAATNWATYASKIVAV